MNNILDIDDKECTSCQMCAAICPSRAVHIELNVNGFYRPSVNEEICNECGQCKFVCYKYDFNKIDLQQDNKKISAFSAKSKNKDLLSSTTSGGIAYLIADLLFRKGYVVVGVIYDYDNDIAKHCVADSICTLHLFKGSKYIQSYTLDALKIIVEKAKNSNIKFAIFGTPCQIYSISKLIKLKKLNRGNFILVDIFCHGCPSMLSWKLTVDYCKRKLKTNRFDSVDFRSKINKWHNYSLLVTHNHNEISMNVYDLFYFLFFTNSILNDGCYNCKLRSSLQYTDIRLGDFWGDRYDLDETGMSVVIPVSYTGNLILESIKTNIVLANESFDNVVKYQSYGKQYDINLMERCKLLSLLKSSGQYECILQDLYNHLSFKRKLIMKIKRKLIKWPYFQSRCRVIYHKMRY